MAPTRTEASAGPWYQRDADLKSREQRAVATRFPYFEWGERDRPVRHAFWRGYLHPLNAGTDIDQVAAELTKGSPVLVGQTGSLHPLGETSSRSDLSVDTDDFVPYIVEVAYSEPPGVPSCLILAPRIDLTAFPSHPHLVEPTYSGVFGPAGPITRGACVFAPHDGLWSWSSSTAADVIEWTAIWLACHIIWKNTGDWPGPQASHHPVDLFGGLDPRGQCHCGSGLQYKDCHREFDKSRTKEFMLRYLMRHQRGTKRP